MDQIRVRLITDGHFLDRFLSAIIPSIGRMFDIVGISWGIRTVRILLDDKDFERLRKQCQEDLSLHGTRIFICASRDMIIPAVVSSVNPVIPVISVVPDKHYFEERVPVSIAGTGTLGVIKAAVTACQILAIKDNDITIELRNFLASEDGRKLLSFDLPKSCFVPADDD